MAYKETFWMACDSTEQLRAEYGPFHTRAEAEQEARKLAFGYLLRYEHIIGDKVSMSGTDVDGEPIETEFVTLRNYAKIRTGSTHWTFVCIQPPSPDDAAGGKGTRLKVHCFFRIWDASSGQHSAVRQLRR